MALFTQPRGETCAKRDWSNALRVDLATLWRSPSGPKSTLWAAGRATLQASPRLFRQFQEWCFSDVDREHEALRGRAGLLGPSSRPARSNPYYPGGGGGTSMPYFGAMATSLSSSCASGASSLNSLAGLAKPMLTGCPSTSSKTIKRNLSPFRWVNLVPSLSHRCSPPADSLRSRRTACPRLPIW